MAQPQYQMQPQRPQQQSPSVQTPNGPFSPPQPASTPGTPQAFPMPPHKRQKLSPGPQSQPGTPYNLQTQTQSHQSPYTASPITPGQTSTTASPHFSNTQLTATTSMSTTANNPPNITTNPSTPSTPTPTTPSFGAIPQSTNVYTTPYSGGNSNTPINIPQNPLNAHYQQSGNYNLGNSQQAPPNYQHQHHPPPSHHHQQQQQQQIQQSPNGFHPNQYNNQGNFQGNAFNMPPQGAGSMGPPTKPVERENANDDQTDVLANAGVDLRAEESYAMSFYTGSFGSQPKFSEASQPSGGHAFTQYNPGDAKSFYGAGPLNQVGEAAAEGSQEKFTKEQADEAWAKAASDLARSREHELNNPHVAVAFLWRKMDKIAKENGVSLNTDEGGKMPQLKLASEFKSTVHYRTAVAPQASLTATGGPFLPVDTALADQLALMSLATNTRMRILLEEAFAISRGRRTGADGVVPAEWANAAAPSQISGSTIVEDGAARSGWESAVSPLGNPLKRTNSGTPRLPTPVSDVARTPGETVRYTNELVKALRTIATSERDLEEERLRKRQERANGGTPRGGSVAPGTPANAAAPEPKPMSKKEREKADKGKTNNVDNHAQANATMNVMLGGSKKSKKYSWMTGGTSGASTPGRITTTALPGTPGGPVGGAVMEKVRLTQEGGRPIGGLREHDQKLVEMKDWILTLENDGKVQKALQKAYASSFYDRK